MKEGDVFVVELKVDVLLRTGPAAVAEKVAGNNAVPPLSVELVEAVPDVLGHFRVVFDFHRVDGQDGGVLGLIFEVLGHLALDYLEAVPRLRLVGACSHDARGKTKKVSISVRLWDVMELIHSSLGAL